MHLIERRCLQKTLWHRDSAANVEEKEVLPSKAARTANTLCEVVTVYPKEKKAWIVDRLKMTARVVWSWKNGVWWNGEGRKA